MGLRRARQPGQGRSGRARDPDQSRFARRRSRGRHPGGRRNEAAKELGQYGASTVHASDDAVYDDHLVLPHVHALAELAGQHSPEAILFAMNYDSRDIAGRLSATPRLDADEQRHGHRGHRDRQDCDLRWRHDRGRQARGFAQAGAVPT